MINVTKRNGEVVPFDMEKIHKVINWAIEGFNNVSLSDIEMTANLNLFDGISTTQIHDTLIRSASDLISLETHNYEYVAARLLNFSIRKKVWGESEPPRLFDHIQSCVNSGCYDADVFNYYTESEIHKLGKYIKHNRDDMFTYSGLQQLVDKYLLKNRSTGELYETPQFAYMLIAMIGFQKYPKETRIDYVKKFYDALSLFKINLPTPIMAGVRTNLRQYASCALFDCDDSLDSIFATITSVGYYSAKRAGIGLNAGRIRPINSSIRNGEVIHTGVIPYLKCFESVVKSTQQNGLRGASATVNVPFWHDEIMDVLVLKNNSGTDENRVRKLDYVIQLSKIFYERLINDEEITLFSSHECKDLFDCFGFPEFDPLYLKKEKDKSLKFRKKIRARELAELLAGERFDTARIYIMNIDHCNSHGSFKDRITMTNLCVAPETLILTDKGHITISELEDQFVNVWNGSEFSNVVVKKTGINQKLVIVNLSNGLSLTCTPYHKWYIIKSAYDARINKSHEVRTHELKIGDKLQKFDLPILESDEDFKYAYTHGLFCADGTYEHSGRKRISLYGEKTNLVKHLEIFQNNGTDGSGRVNVICNKDMRPKFEVPMNARMIDKLNWLAGYLDGDGCVVNTQENQALQASSINRQFLIDIQLMLQTLGVNSKITHASGACDRLLPDGNGGHKIYPCKQSYRLLISSNGLEILMNLGFQTNRLLIINKHPQRNAEQFVKVVSIEDNNRYDDTFCVNEPLRNKAIFNGIMTGNCVEITHPTVPLTHIDDENGEIGVCILSCLNVLKTELNEFEEVCDVIVRFLDELIDHQDYPVKAAENFTKNRRSLGIGFTNLAGLFAREKLEYGSKESLELLNKYAEYLQYFLLKSSCNLAKEKGPCSKYSSTKYSDDIFPLNTYNHAVDTLVSNVNYLDWVSLREEIQTNGLRNSTVTAQPPTESSSVIQNSTNGIEPIRRLITYKKSKTGVLTQIVPTIKCHRYYTNAWDIKSNQVLNNISAVIQKWFDMAVSTNHYYNPVHYENGNVPRSVIIKDIVHAYKMGVKTLYYSNINDGDAEQTSNGCDSGACSI